MDPAHERAWTCDILRLDHSRGFESYWEIPASEPDGGPYGKWVRGPADELFNALRASLGDLPFIAEDLGLITEEVHALRERLGRTRHEGAAIRLRRPRRAHLSAAKL